MQTSNVSPVSPPLEVLWKEPISRRLGELGIIFPHGMPSLSSLLDIVCPTSQTDTSSILAMNMTGTFWQELSATRQFHPLATHFVVPPELSGVILRNPNFTSLTIQGLSIRGTGDSEAIKTFLAYRSDLEKLRLTVPGYDIVNAIATCKNLKELTISVLDPSPINVVGYLIKQCPKLTTVYIEGSWLTEAQVQELNRQAALLLLQARHPTPPESTCVSFDSNIVDFAFMSILKGLPSGISVFDLENCANLTDKSLEALIERRIAGINFKGANCISPGALAKFLRFREGLEDLRIRVDSHISNTVGAIGTCIGLKSLSLEINTPDAYLCLVHIVTQCKNLTTLNLNGSRCSLNDEQIRKLLNINPSLSIHLPS